MKITLVIIAASLFTIGFASGYQHGKLNRSDELVPIIKDSQELARLAILELENKASMIEGALTMVESATTEIKRMHEENAKLRTQLASNTIQVYSDSADAYIIPDHFYPIHENDIANSGKP